MGSASAIIANWTLRFDPLTAFGLVAVGWMLVSYALEGRSHWFVLGFVAGCAMGSVYGFLQGAWPFGVVEGVWSVVALRRWWKDPRRPRRKIADGSDGGWRDPPPDDRPRSPRRPSGTYLADVWLRDRY